LSLIYRCLHVPLRTDDLIVSLLGLLLLELKRAMGEQLIDIGTGNRVQEEFGMKRALCTLAMLVMISSAVKAAVPYGYSFSTSPGQVDWRATPLKAQTACAEMANARFGAAQISATVVARAGDVPEHCWIEGSLPTHVGFEVNLPLAWNGRLYMYGNGGYSGEDPKAPHLRYKRDRALANGFATAWTDTGHRASEPTRAEVAGASFAQSRVALTNHAYLAVHLTVEFAKRVAEGFYGRAPSFSYWDGCSTGGREGVMEAYRFPTDFNGILAAAPTLDWTSIMIKGLWQQSATQGSGLTVDKLQTVFRAVLKKCDAIDGVADGLIDDPRRCAFDPQRDVPHCAAGEDGKTCLTQRQADALTKIYDGPPKGQGMPNWVREYPGFEDGSVLAATPGAQWVLTREGTPNTLSLMASVWMKYFSFEDTEYDASKFDFIRDPPRARAADEEMNPKPDLKPFEEAGGKMITWWGWSDPALNPGMGIDFYDRVIANYGLETTQQFYRLFMIPGVSHCSGGYGPCAVDGMPALIDWVEKRIAPERLQSRRTAEDGKTIYNRSYCAYPAVTRYKGGDPEAPSNYRCEPGMLGLENEQSKSQP